MGATAESRRAASRERRLLREVDPKLAAILDQEELERARQDARRIRKGRGLSQVDPEPPKPKAIDSVPPGYRWAYRSGQALALIVPGILMYLVLDAILG
jgi:hypothetical protein